MSEPACSESDHPRPVEVERPRLAEVAVLAPLRTTFDYLVPAHAAGLRPGQRVCVPFGRVRRTGVVLALKSDTDVAHERLKPLYSVLDEEPVLDASLLELLKFMSRYFHHPPGDVAATLLPAPLRRPRPLPRPTRTVVAMSDAGRRALQRREPALLRAPRRLELLQRLEQQSEPLAVDALDGGGKRWGRVIAQARDRGLVCVEAQAVSALEPSADSPSMAPGRGPATEIVHELNAAQRAAVDGVRASDGFKVHLLQGVTGSGKT
ncbi:MAG: hypothetical protein KDK91_15690, partial [Gammaproteobacteria bacterium]|nr:hypothetical protein [Gammaproteobacteria bacterium]